MNTCELSAWAPKWNISNFVKQDSSHILHGYFVGVFFYSHPSLQERDFVLIITGIKLVPWLYLVILPDEVCVIRQDQSEK